MDGDSSLAFDSNGNLFEADGLSGNIFKFTSGGAQSLFASGLAHPLGLAFDASGNLFVSEESASDIIKFTSGGSESIFATDGLDFPSLLVFGSVPEPSCLVLAALGLIGLVALTSHVRR